MYVGIIANGAILNIGQAFKITRPNYIKFKIKLHAHVLMHMTVRYKGPLDLYTIRSSHRQGLYPAQYISSLSIDHTRLIS